MSSRTSTTKRLPRPPKVDLPKEQQVEYREWPFIQEAFKAYISHVTQGHPDGCFYYRNRDGFGIGLASLQRGIARYKDALAMDRLEEALVLRYRIWLGKGMQILEETKSNALYLALMSNLFPDQGWNKESPVKQVTNEADVRKLLKSIGADDV
jgi:hypothetical protein